ncbi:MAG: glycosyltransferase [Verrucomicrobiota bacterium]
MAEPLVSIIIPCHNGRDYVADAIRSALDQTYCSVEVIVVDDGSTDGSPDVIRSFGDRIRRLAVPHRGGGAARNAGLESSRGDFIQFLDADDTLLPNALRRRIEVISEGTADMVFCDSGILPAPDVTVPTKYSPPYANEDPVLFVLRYNIQTLTPLHRRKNLLAIGGWRTDLPCAQEFDLHLRLVCSGCTLHHLPEVLCRVRKVPGSVSSDYVRVLDQFSGILEPAYAGLKESGRLSDERAQAFAAAMARAARHYLQRNEVQKGQSYFQVARRMHPGGGIRQVYSAPGRVLFHTLGPAITEKLVGGKRRWFPADAAPAGPKEPGP